MVVALAAKDSATNGSSAWCPPLASHASSGYGCSVTNTLSNPASSAARATTAMPSALTNSAPAPTRSVGRPTWNLTPGSTTYVDCRRASHLLLPDLLLPGDLAAFRDEVRTFLRAEMPASSSAGHRDPTDLTGWDEAFERELLARAGAAGLLGVSLPTDYGGGGKPRSWQAVVSFEAAYHDAPMIDTAAVLVAPTVLAFGSEAQRSRFLPAAIAGSCTACIAYTEAGRRVRPREHHDDRGRRRSERLRARR